MTTREAARALNQTVYDRYEDGETLKSIADDYGVTPERIRQRIDACRRRLEYFGLVPKLPDHGDVVTIVVDTPFGQFQETGVFTRWARSIGRRISQVSIRSETDGCWYTGRAIEVIRKEDIQQ